MRNPKIILAALAVLSLAVMPLQSVSAAGATVGDIVDIPAVQLLDGTQLPPGHFRGVPVVVEYWASWCPFCARQNPYVQKLYERAKGSKLAILTVSIDKQAAPAQEYMQKHGYTFPVALETPALRDVFGKTKTIPKIIVVQPDGKVAEIIPGEMFEEDVLNLIKYAGKPTSED